MSRQWHCSTSIAILFFLFHDTANIGSHAFSAPTHTRGIPRLSPLVRHSSLLPPLRYLSSDDERDVPPANSEKILPKKKTMRSFLHRLDRFLTDLQMTKYHLRHHPYLAGNYAPVDVENVELEVEVVEGQIPQGIWGAFLRNGPNPKREWMRKRYHWFDGHAMMHTLLFKDGKATYTNQFIPSPRYEIEKELDEDYFPTIGEYVGFVGLLKIMFAKQLVKEKMSDDKMALPPNTSVLMFNNKLYCLHEASLPMECRMNRNGRLEYMGYETFHSALDYPFTAHPIKDGNNLIFHSYTTDTDIIKEHGVMKVGIFRPKRNAVEPYFVPTSDKSHVSFAHCFAHTKNYIVIWDCSVHFQQDAILTGASFFSFNQKHNLKFGLVPKNATRQEDVIWIDSQEPGAILHPLHAWEEIQEEYLDGDKISARTVIKLWTPLSQDFYMDVEQSSTFRMVEFTIDLKDQSVYHEVIDHSVNTEMSVMPPPLSDSKRSVEFASCSVNSPFSPRKDHSNGTVTQCTSTLSPADRFGYSAIFVDDGVFVGYAQWDLLNKCLARTVRYRENEIGGEPVVMRDSKDDAVYVGSYVYNKDEDKSYFLLYDAMTGCSVCRLRMPQRVPQGIHGTFISGDELESHFQYHEKNSMIFDRELWDDLFRNSNQS